MGSARAAMGDVIALTDQALVHLAGEKGDAVHTSVVVEHWQTATTCRQIATRAINASPLSRV